MEEILEDTFLEKTLSQSSKMELRFTHSHNNTNERGPQGRLPAPPGFQAATVVSTGNHHLHSTTTISSSLRAKH